ncbi:MAG: hypothetical protein ACPG5P_06835, partial [Saprospiraceae bacterium]
MNDFDNIDFDELFNDAELPIDTAEVWDAVEPRLEKKKKRRFFFLLFWGVGASFIISLGLWLGYGSFNENSTADNSQVIENIPLEDFSETSQNGQADDYNSLAETMIEKNVSDENGNSKKSNISMRNTAQITNENSSISRKNRDESSFIPSINPLISDTGTNGSQISSNQENINDGKDNELTENAEKDEAPKSQKEKDSTKNTSDKSKKKTLKDKEEKDKKKKDKPKQKKKSKKKRKSKWTVFFDIYGGGSYPFRQLSENPNVLGSATNLLDARRENEKMLFSYHGGIDIKYAHKRGLLLGAGFQYERITERFKYTSQTTEVETEQAVISQVVDDNNNLVSEEIGLVEVTTITTRKISIYNQHDFYNIPISIGYRYKYNKKLYLEYTGGLDLNIMFRAKGYHFTENLTTEAVKGNFKKGAVSPSLWGAFGIDY